MGESSKPVKFSKLKMSPEITFAKMKTLPNRSLALLFFTLFSCFLSAQQNQQTSGAVIVVALNGDAHLVDLLGNKTGEDLVAGLVIPVSQSVATKQGASLTLLLSNGTLLTMQENSVMKVGTFKQEPFDAKGKKIADLDGEPSASNTVIDLDLGSLVVKTKKLNRKSSLDINTPVGVAGIRGTEFQMGIQPDGAMQLDVTESTVSFTPPGGQPTMVTEGRGLDVSGAGIATPRPVNPVVAENISVVNESATQATADIPLESVSQVMAEIEAAETGEVPDSQPAENTSPTEGEPQESSPAGEKPSGDTMQQTIPQVDIEEMLEQNPDTKQVRKTGELGAPAEELQKYPLNAAALEKFLSLPQSIQKSFLSYDFSVVERLMNMNGFNAEQAESFFSYSQDARKLILGLEDTPLLALINQQLEEAIVLATFSDDNLALSGLENLPGETEENPLEERILNLGNSLRESGNSQVYDEILTMAGGMWTENWLRTAEVANMVLQDYTVSPDNQKIAFLSGAEVFANPFYLEIASLYQILESDVMVWGNDPNFFGGKNVDFLPGNYDFSDSMGQASIVTIAAEESLSVSGEYNIDLQARPETRVVMMSGDNLDVQDGTTITSSLNDLVVASRSDVLLRNSTLDSAREIAIRSLRDVELNQVSLSAVDMIRVKAERDINVDGMVLNPGLPFLIMEATTIRLRNVDFPLATQVQLNSLKGPIDGRYPNFGTAIPLSDQIGRVNFIENIRSGGNLLMDRPSFDQFGGNINIGKLP